jgi:hypothetical protein
MGDSNSTDEKGSCHFFFKVVQIFIIIGNDWQVFIEELFHRSGEPLVFIFDRKKVVYGKFAIVEFVAIAKIIKKCRGFVREGHASSHIF